MKTILTFVTLVITSCFSLFAQQQEDVVNNDDLFAPFRTVYRNVESVDFSTPRSQRQGSALKHHIYGKHDMMNGVYYGGQFELSGKYKSGVSVRSDDHITVRRGSVASGRSVSDRNQDSKKRQLDRRSRFMRNKQAAMEEARLREEERKRRDKEEDDKRAAIATQKANERMQPVTDARIDRDRYNAGQGLQNAREASRQRSYSNMRGYVKPQRHMPGNSSGVTDALSKTHKMHVTPTLDTHSTLHPRLLQRPLALKKPKPYVYRKVSQNNKYEFTGRMTKTAIYIDKDTRFGVSDRYDSPGPVAGNHGFRLSPDAVVTTGQLIDNGELKARYIPERPKKISQRRHDYDWDKMMDELLQ